MNEQTQPVTDILARYQSGIITRRRALQLLSALGVTGLAAPALSQSLTLAQDTASPVAMATPVLGPQADGSNVWRVQVGGMDMETGTDTHAFYPEEITINAGDSIFFQFAPMGMPGFHTITFTSGADIPPLFVPDVVEGTPVASPEGPPQIILNPMLAFPDGRTNYDGTGMTNSGLDVFRMDQGPYTLVFDTPGTYEYACAVHFVVMKGTVIVQETGAALPNDQAAYDAMADAKRTELVEIGKAAIADAEAAAAAATPAASGATTRNVAAGVGGLTQARVMRFIPREITVKVGDTVRWTDQTTGEPHTVTFLGGTEPPEDTIVEPQPDGTPKFIQSYQTFLPAGDPSFDGTGYHNSGFLGQPPEVQQMFGLNGDTYDLTFTAAGDYPYYCILHSSGPDDPMGMVGKVTVTE